MGSAVKRTPKSGRQSLFYQDLASPITGSRISGSKFSTPGQVAAKTPGWRNFLAYVGPGFLVSLAYLDLENLETDMQASADHGFELLWVLLIAMDGAVTIRGSLEVPRRRGQGNSDLEEQLIQSEFSLNRWNWFRVLASIMAITKISGITLPIYVMIRIIISICNSFRNRQHQYEELLDGLELAKGDALSTWDSVRASLGCTFD